MSPLTGIIVFVIWCIPVALWLFRRYQLQARLVRWQREDELARRGFLTCDDIVGGRKHGPL